MSCALTLSFSLPCPRVDFYCVQVMTTSICINPASKTVSKIPMHKSVAELMHLVGGYFDAVRLANGDYMYVNEEAWTAKGTFVLREGDHQETYTGTAVIVGIDADGKDCAGVSTVLDTKRAVFFPA